MAASVRISIERTMALLLFLAFVSHSVDFGEAQGYPSVANIDACQAARIPCGGHTGSSCMNYCISSGYSQGTCDGSCCMCSNGGQYTSSSLTNSMNMNTAYFNTGGRNHRRGNTSAFVPGPFLTLDFFGNHINQMFHQQQQQQQHQQQQQRQQKSTDIFWQSPSTHQLHHKMKDNILPFNNKNDIPVADNNGKMKGMIPAPSYNSKDTCPTQVCQDEALDIRSQMDEGVDPCDDFYQFACGGFIKKYSNMAHHQVEVTPFSILRDKVFSQLNTLFEEGIRYNEPKPFKLVKNMYKSCMNTRLIENRGFQPILKSLDEVGGWPVLDGAGWQSRTEFKWENFAIWFKELGLPMNVFMSFLVQPDMKNVGKRYITIGEPTLGLSDQVMRRGLNEPIVSSYYQYMVDTAVLFGADRSTAKTEMLDAVNLEVGMAQCFFRSDQSRSGSFYNPMTIQQLSAKYPYVPWLQLFQRFVASPVHITNQEVIMVSVPQYLDCFFTLLTRTEQKAMVNYAIWKAVAASSAYLPGSVRSLQQNFASKITGQKERKPRWKECTEIAQVNLGNAVGAMYVRRYFKDISKSHALEMVKDIQRAFLEILKDADWMDAYTKGKAREKALEMLVHIGYPEEHKSDAKLSSLYSKFDFDETDYFGNIRNLVTGATSVMFSKLREPIRRNEWTSHGHNAVVNAFYQPQENSIQFPAAILQGHFFNASRPNYLNYAAIGWIMGHEITHGFDDQGHQFGKHGNHLNWWAPTTKDTYNRRKQCIVDQYSGFQSRSTGLRLNGERSQGENIADNGGIKQAYLGYSYWTGRNTPEKGLPGLRYTPDQLFWISAAQNWCAVQRTESLKHSIMTGVHSPPEFRVRGTFSNIEEFSRDFKCMPGKRMNPTRKCSVW